MSSLADELGLSDQEVSTILGAYLNEDVIGIFTYGIYAMVFGSTIRHIGMICFERSKPSLLTKVSQSREVNGTSGVSS